MVKYSQAILNLARQYRVPARVTQEMVDTGTIPAEKLINGSQELDGLITVGEAAERFQISEWTLRTWLFQGYLHKYHGDKAFVRGGRIILIDPNEVNRLHDNPPKRGRPFSVVVDN